MTTMVPPEVDMWMVSKNLRAQRRSTFDVVPKTGLSIVNYGDLERIDNFYLECQNYRDYYRDPYNKLTPPPMFQRYLGRCGVPPDRDVALLMRPITYVGEWPPVVYPIEYSRGMNLNTYGPIAGRYNSFSCNRFKH